MFRMELPQNARTILSVLRAHGYHGYVVGGCVRDACMGLPPHDYDITTDASPPEVQEAFRDYRVLETGIRHGTVTVLIDHEPFEITTFRIDGDYTDCRHPNDVTFTTRIEDDLARRDFTVNAMACDGETLVDPFGGQADAAKRILRCVGDANRRFQEDGLRILRALRFSAVLDFTIEPDTASAVHGNRDLLRKIAVERLYAETRKLLVGINAPAVLRAYADVMRVFLPGLSDAGLQAVEGTERDLLLRLALLLTGTNAESALRDLHADNKTIRAVCELHRTPLTDGRHLLAALSPDQAKRRIAYAAALGEIGDANAAARLEELRDILADKPCLTLRDLKVDGRDMQSLGLSGTQIGKALNALLDRVLSGTLANEHEALLDEVRKMDPEQIG